MPFTNSPNISGEIKIKKEEVLNLLLASIAFEQFGLSRIINTEVEKFQCILDIFQKNQTHEILTTDDLIQINSAARKIFRTVINNHILLQLKFQDILEIAIAKTATDIPTNDITSTPNAKSTQINDMMSTSNTTSATTINKRVNVLSSPLLHNNINTNISINCNSILLPTNSNVIKTTKTSFGVSINKPQSYQKVRI